VIGLWAGSTYVPTAVTEMAKDAGYSKGDTVHLASLASCIVAVFTVLGCCVVPAMVKRMGRRNALALLYLLMIVGTAGAYEWRTRGHSIPGFFAFLPLLGFGGAKFEVFTIWLPEQYPTKVRATAFAFTTTMSRWVAAGGTGQRTRTSRRRSSSAPASAVRPEWTGPGCTTVLRGAVSQRNRAPRDSPAA
jgi:hypothetical protein